MKLTRILTTLAVVVLGAVLLLGDPAAASEAVSTAAPGATPVEIDVTVLAFITGSLMPLLTALVTKISASSSVKAISNLVLSIVAGVVSAFVAHNGRLTLIEIGAAAIAAYLASQATYTGLWKGTGIVQKIASTSSDVGLGKAA